MGDGEKNAERERERDGRQRVERVGDKELTENLLI